MSKFGHIKQRQVPLASTSLPIAAIGLSRRHIEALMGMVMMVGVMIPVMYYPGLIVIVIFVEIYLIHAVYSRVFGVRVKALLPLQRGTRTRETTAHDFIHSSLKMVY
ncbi:MAG: hypothetical protein ACW960_04425 [Candidatus Thorarchaeota archaeon]|jgi:hypothetical protein